MDNIELKRTTSANPDFRLLVVELDVDLRVRNGEVMDIYDQHNIIEQIDTVVIAYMGDIPAGCGCFKKFSTDAVEIKRMFVRHNFRGKGISAAILRDLEKWALEEGFKFTVLETGNRQTEALGLYQKMGYENIPKYEPYVDLPDSICFRKQLV
jgi:GNAT superfamily N-acetyltransferase